MLVSIHKQILILILFLGFRSADAQVWTLEKSIDTALVHNKNLQISRNTIAIGEQMYGEAKANLLPKITANADYRYFTNLPYQLMPLSVFGGPDGQFKEAQFGVPHNMSANLQLSMPLYNPQAYGALKTAALALEMTNLQYQKTEEQIYFEVSNLYYNAQILHHQLAFIDENLLNAKKLLQNVQLLNIHLLATKTDVSKVKLQAAQITTQKESISSKYEQVLNALKYTLGISIKQNFQIQPDIQYQQTGDYTNSSIVDIDIIETQYRILRSELNTLKNTKLPSLSLFGTYGSTGFGYDKKPNQFLKFYPIGFVGVQLSYPLFNGTVTKRKINQKNLELQNGNIQLEQVAEQLKMQAENSELQRSVAEKSVETTSEQIKLAQTIYDQSILQQKLGTASLTDVLLADNALREAQQTYLSAVIDYLKADLELKKATGNISLTK